MRWATHGDRRWRWSYILQLNVGRIPVPAIANFNYTRPRIRSRVRFRLSGFALAGSSVCIAGAKGKGEGARRRATQHGEAERRRDLRSADVAPTSPVHTTFARHVTVQAGDTDRLSLFPPPEITLSRDPVGLLGLSPNRRTPCGRCRVPRQRSYVVSRVCPGSPRCLFTGTVCVPAPPGVFLPDQYVPVKRPPALRGYLSACCAHR
jgi:hypothetical protein